MLKRRELDKKMTLMFRDGVVFDTKGVIIPQDIKLPMSLGYGLLTKEDRGMVFTRYSCKDRPTYRLILNKTGMYKIGPKFGIRVRPWEKEVDPLRKLLKCMDISVSVIVKDEEEEGSSFIEWDNRKIKHIYLRKGWTYKGIVEEMRKELFIEVDCAILKIEHQCGRFYRTPTQQEVWLENRRIEVMLYKS